MYMLDTNICIYVLKNHSDQLRHKFKAIKHLCISSVTYAELCSGIENSDGTKKEERWAQLDLFTQRHPPRKLLPNLRKIVKAKGR